MTKSHLNKTKIELKQKKFEALSNKHNDENKEVLLNNLANEVFSLKYAKKCLAKQIEQQDDEIKKKIEKVKIENIKQV